MMRLFVGELGRSEEKSRGDVALMWDGLTEGGRGGGGCDQNDGIGWMKAGEGEEGLKRIGPILSLFLSWKSRPPVLHRNQ